MKNIFIAFTPYHVLLSYAIALNEANSGENHLFLISDFSYVEPLIHSLKGWSRCPFAQIECLPGVYSQESMSRRRFTVRENIAPIMQSVRENGVRRVYVFHDGRAEAQTALHFAKKGNKGTVGVYVEDGAGAYSSYGSTKRSLHKLLLGKLFYGSWWEDVSVLGTSRWIDEVKAIFPQLVRPDLRMKHVTSISRHALLELRNQDWPYEYLKTLGVRIAELNDLDAILIVAHSEFASQIPGYKQVIKDVLTAAKDQGLRVAIKYHPREPLGDFLSVGNADGVVILPQSLSIELVYILTPKQVRFVVGDISTSLLTAKWLLDNATVISIAPLLGQSDSQPLIKVFRELDIKIVTNFRAIGEILQQ
jgi:hypothetical protein